MKFKVDKAGVAVFLATMFNVGIGVFVGNQDNWSTAEKTITCLILGAIVGVFCTYSIIEAMREKEKKDNKV